MSTDISIIPEGMENTTDLATLLGFSKASEQQSTLPELQQLYKAVKGEMEVKGRMMTVETISGGGYQLKRADGTVVYSDTVEVRVFMQRYHYQRYEKFAAPVDGKDGKMFRSVMANDLKGDLQDNYGGYNCGRPGGFIKDYDSLVGPMRDIVKNTKRVMVVFGLVKLTNPVDANGNPVELDEPISPFFMRVKNPKSYKAVDKLAKDASKRNRLPIHFWSAFSSSHEMLANGEPNYFITAELTTSAELTAEDQHTVRDFLDWIEFQNKGILYMWDKSHANDMSDEDRSVVEQFVNIEGSYVEVEQ
jgi:hypothetical protein